MEAPLEYEAYETAYDDMHAEEGMKKSKVWGAKKYSITFVQSRSKQFEHFLTWVSIFKDQEWQTRAGYWWEK